VVEVAGCTKAGRQPAKSNQVLHVQNRQTKLEYQGHFDGESSGMILDGKNAVQRAFN
jgi:hypothetical protein